MYSDADSTTAPANSTKAIQKEKNSFQNSRFMGVHCRR